MRINKTIKLLIAGLFILSSLAVISPATGNAINSNSIWNSSSSSYNWSGYAVTSGTNSVSYVSATWTVPSVTCIIFSGYQLDYLTSAASMWIGIDGYNSPTVEQTGIEMDCNSGTPSYYVWWELYPDFASQYLFSVNAGDTITAHISYYPGTLYNPIKSLIFSIQDTTTGSSSYFSRQIESSWHRSSAEWVVERPSFCSSGCYKYLSNFGTATFNSAQTSISGSTHGISGNVYQITMKNSQGNNLAVPSSTYNSGESFHDYWYNYL